MKTSGLGDGLLVGSHVMSGDVQSLGSISTPRGSLDFTGIDKYANERQYSTKDGALSMTTYWNPGVEADAAHNVLSVLPRSDVQVVYQRGKQLGDAAWCCVSKQINYDGSRGTDGSFTFGVDVQANGFGADWGEQLTPGMQALTAAGNGDGLDLTDVSTLFGWQAYLAVGGVTGTSVTVTLQDSADDATYANLTGGAFTAATGPAVQRLAGGRTATVRRYVRAVYSGTFTAATVAVVFVRNRAAALT